MKQSKAALDQRARALLKRMEGVTVALFTPLNSRGTVDVSGLERLVERGLKAESQVRGFTDSGGIPRKVRVF